MSAHISFFRALSATLLTCLAVYGAWFLTLTAVRLVRTCPRVCRARHWMAGRLQR